MGSNQYAGTLSLINPATTSWRERSPSATAPRVWRSHDGLVWVGARPADTSHRGGTLTVLATGHVDTVDPLLTQNLYSILPLAYDGLTAYQRVGGSGSVQLVPDLAVSLPSPTDGGTTYTFQLRRGIRYSNGEPLRPEDFRRALERDLILGGTPTTAARSRTSSAAPPARPTPATATSRGAWSSTTPPTPSRFTWSRRTPSSSTGSRSQTPTRCRPAYPTTTSAFTRCPPPARTSGSTCLAMQVTLVRNPYFHEWSHAARPDGYPDRIVFRGAVSWEAGITAVERGAADYMIDGVPPDRMAEAQTRFASQLYITPTSSTVR